MPSNRQKKRKLQREREYNKRLRNSHNGAGNKPARMVVEALIVKHVEKLSDEKTIQAIQENPYMQYLLGLEKFTEKPVFVPELFVLVRKRLDHDFFNMLTLMLAETDGSKPKKEHTDEDGNDHGGTMKICLLYTSHRLGFSQKWITDFIFQVVMLAKKEPKAGQEDAANNKK